mgnify:FL=1
MMRLWSDKFNRHHEIAFLAIGSMLIGGGFYHLSSLFSDRAGMIGFLFSVWGICLIVGKVLLQWGFPNHHPILFPMMMFLVGWGLLILARLVPILAIRQAIWLIVAWCVMFIIILLPNFFIIFKRFSWWIFGLTLLLLLTTFVVGVHPSLPAGAPALWLSLDLFFMQPAELLKWVLIGIFAIQIEQKNWQKIITIWGLVILLFIIQRDLGVAVLFCAVLFQLAYLAGIQRRILGISLTGMIVIGIIGFFLLPIIRLRVAIWLNPWVDVAGDSYQLVQSLFAFADGGIFGRGFGTGEPELIPLAHSDFIFSAIAEEWGLMGVFILIGLLAMLIRICLMIGKKQSETSYRFWAWGIGAMLISQNVMIMAGALRIFPLTGMPFTFVSYGGSSLVVSMMMMGVLLRLSALPTITPDTNLNRETWYLRGILLILGVVGCVAFYWAVLWGRS